LWVHIARGKEGDSRVEELRRNAAKVNLNEWPGPVLALYLGEATLDQVRSAAARGEAKTQEEQNCQAAFYIGEYELQRKNETNARRLLKTAAERCAKDLIEQRAAVSELRRIGPR